MKYAPHGFARQGEFLDLYMVILAMVRSKISVRLGGILLDIHYI
jgi:hypothetical protein